MFATMARVSMSRVKSDQNPSVIKLICLLAILQSFVVDRFIFDIYFTATQISMGVAVLALAALTLGTEAIEDT